MSAPPAIEYLNAPWQQVTPGRTADLVILDPVYESRDLSYLPAAAQCLRPGGSLYCFQDASGVAQVKVSLDAFSDLQFANWLIWGPNDWGGRSKTRWGQKHDDLLFYTRTGAPHTFNARAVGVPKRTAGTGFDKSGRDWKIPSSVWADLAGFHTMSSERVRIDGKAVRWQKPEALIERIILASSNPGDLILDFFGGVATVPAVAHRLGRRCISCELDPEIWLAGHQRLEDLGAFG